MKIIDSRSEAFNRRDSRLSDEAAERRAVREAVLRDALAGADDSPRGEGTSALDFDSRAAQKARLQRETGA